MAVEAGLADGARSEAEASIARGARSIWRYALAAWLGQRLLLGALVAFFQSLMGVLSPRAFFLIWTALDGQWYISIARDDYYTIPQAAYYPLYPLMMRLTAPLTGGNLALAGIILSNLFTLGAFILLGYLVAQAFGSRVAQRVLLFYAIFPTGFFLVADYTEGLFLLLSVATFLCIRQRRWLLSGALITLATLTRAPGALLLVPLVIEAWQTLRPRWPALGHEWRLRETLMLVCAITAPLLAFLAFQIYLAQVYGMSNVVSRAIAQPQWRRYLDWPWAGALIDINTLYRMVRGATFQAYPGLMFSDVLALVFWLGACIVMSLPSRLAITPSLPRSWVAYSWVALLQALMLPAHLSGEGLMSIPRYVLVIFPCFTVLALVGARSPRAHLIMFALCLAWTIILMRLISFGDFVA